MTYQLFPAVRGCRRIIRVAADYLPVSYLVINK
jgi:hypothetical protein